MGQIQAEQAATIVEKPVEEKKPAASSSGADGISFGGMPKFLGGKGGGKPLNQALFPEIGGEVDAAAAAAEKTTTSSSSASSGFSRGGAGGPPSFSGSGAGKNRFGEFKGTEYTPSSTTAPVFGKGPSSYGNGGAKKGSLAEWSKNMGGNDELDRKIEAARKEAEEKREKERQHRETRIAEREARGFAKDIAKPDERPERSDRPERREYKERSDVSEGDFKRGDFKKCEATPAEPKETFTKKEKPQKSNGMQSENWDEAGF